MTPTEAEANAILNRFAGWKPEQPLYRCYRPTCDRGGTTGPPTRTWCLEHDRDIPPTDYFADTPEAREAVRLLKDEFVRRTKRYHIKIETYLTYYGGEFMVRATVVDDKAEVDEESSPYIDESIESHAIALALAAALKERGE